MIKKLSLVLVIALLGSIASVGQESTPKFEAFGGYSYFNGGTAGLTDRYSLNGWNAQGTYNFNRWLGLTADFSGEYGSPFGADVHSHNFLFGPTVSYRTAHFTPFAHALFGVNDASASLSSSLLGTTVSSNDTAFAFAIGGGVDVPWTHRISVRVAQVDWLRTQHFDTNQDNLRVSTGLVFRF